MQQKIASDSTPFRVTEGVHCFLVHLGQFSGQLIEHTSFAHVNLDEADKLDWIEADRPVLKFIQDNCQNVFRK